MELLGFQRCVQSLQDQNINISVLVTDRHIQVNKYIRENMKETDHRFDVWHIAKCVFHYCYKNNGLNINNAICYIDMTYYFSYVYFT